MRGIPRRFILVFVGALGLTGCLKPASTVPMDYRWANVEGSQLDAPQAGEQFYFHIFVDEGILAEGVPLKIRVSGSLRSGSLRFELRRPDGKAVWGSAALKAGEFSVGTEYLFPPGQVGTYSLGLVYGDHTSATYHLAWHALKLGPQVLLPGLGMVLVALAFVLGAAWRRRLDGRFLGLGALFWGLTVAAKFAVAIPANPLVFQALGVSHDHPWALGNLVASVYIGALTGLFEAGLAWAVLRRSRWGQARWGQALSFGIGFGAVEALLLGLASAGSALAGLLSPDTLSVSTLGALAHQAAGPTGLAPIVERLSVIPAHLMACVLVFHAIARRQARWGWLAILYKTLLDAPGGFGALSGATTPERLWTLEALLAIFGALGLWGTVQLAKRYPGDGATLVTRGTSPTGPGSPPGNPPGP